MHSPDARHIARACSVSPALLPGSVCDPTRSRIQRGADRRAQTRVILALSVTSAKLVDKAVEPWFPLGKTQTWGEHCLSGRLTSNYSQAPGTEHVLRKWRLLPWLPWPNPLNWR